MRLSEDQDHSGFMYNVFGTNVIITKKNFIYEL